MLLNKLCILFVCIYIDEKYFDYSHDNYISIALIDYFFEIYNECNWYQPSYGLASSALEIFLFFYLLRVKILKFVGPLRKFTFMFYYEIVRIYCKVFVQWPQMNLKNVVHMIQNASRFGFPKWEMICNFHYGSEDFNLIETDVGVDERTVSTFLLFSSPLTYISSVVYCIRFDLLRSYFEALYCTINPKRISSRTCTVITWLIFPDRSKKKNYLFDVQSYAAT